MLTSVLRSCPTFPCRLIANTFVRDPKDVRTPNDSHDCCFDALESEELCSRVSKYSSSLQGLSVLTGSDIDEDDASACDELSPQGTGQEPSEVCPLVLLRIEIMALISHVRVSS